MKTKKRNHEEQGDEQESSGGVSIATILSEATKKKRKKITASFFVPESCPTMKPHPRALFDLLHDYDYKKSVDKSALMARVVEIVEADPGSVRRKFWSLPCSYEGLEADFPGRYARDYDHENGRDVDAGEEDLDGIASPTYWAAMQGLPVILCYLLDNGGRINEATAIDCAVMWNAHAAIVGVGGGGSLECLKILVERGCDHRENFCINDGDMLNVAKQMGRKEIEAYLRTIGYDSDGYDSDQ